MKPFEVEGHVYRVSDQKMDPFTGAQVRRKYMPVMIAPIVNSKVKVFETEEEKLAHISSEITRSLADAMRALTDDEFNFICDSTLPFVERQIIAGGKESWGKVYAGYLNLAYKDIDEVQMWALVREVMNRKMRPFIDGPPSDPKSDGDPE